MSACRGAAAAVIAIESKYNGLAGCAFGVDFCAARYDESGGIGACAADTLYDGAFFDKEGFAAIDEDEAAKFVKVIVCPTDAICAAIEAGIGDSYGVGGDCEGWGVGTTAYNLVEKRPAAIPSRACGVYSADVVGSRKPSVGGCCGAGQGGACDANSEQKKGR